MFKVDKERINYIDTEPKFEPYRYSNRGEYKVLLCEFPKLIGNLKLTRPDHLPRSLHHPYLSGQLAPIDKFNERKILPHTNEAEFWFRRKKPSKNEEENEETNDVVQKSELDETFEVKVSTIESLAPEPELVTHGAVLEKILAAKKVVQKRRRRFPAFIQFREETWRQAADEQDYQKKFGKTDETMSLYIPPSVNFDALKSNIDNVQQHYYLHQEENEPLHSTRCRVLGSSRAANCKGFSFGQLEDILKLVRTAPQKSPANTSKTTTNYPDNLQTKEQNMRSKRYDSLFNIILYGGGKKET